MADTVIRVENLCKQYRLGAINHGTLRADLASWWARMRGHEDPNLSLDDARLNMQAGEHQPDRFWALKDVSFEVRQGEVLGIIGKNGAGKSTLLKILSRVTTPTRGQIKVRGRIASLLEVGTGFHPELSGRENIFLNGAILGMRKDEIRRKLDEIIAFAEVEQFIDTPVKRYSSGMYVRLAFAVAAHLEPEILVVDEVLAVGDAEFQKKCLGKMSDVASHGRTVLFVSHNMQAVQSLCTRCCLLDHGKKVTDSSPEKVVNEYLSSADVQSVKEWSDKVGLGSKQVSLKRISVFADEAENSLTGFLSKDDLHVELEVTLESDLSGLCVGYDLFDERGGVVFRSYNTDVRPDQFAPLRLGTNVLRCRIPKGLLNAGRYFVAPRIGIHNQMWIVHSDPLISFSMTLTHGVSPFWNSLSEGSRPGAIAPIFHWTTN